MHVALGKVKAAWECGDCFHSFSHAYLKTLSKTTQKIKVWCMLHG